MPVAGNTVLPSRETDTPDTPVPAHVLLTPEDFDIPQKRCFTPGELAPIFLVCSRTITRMIEDGQLRAVKVGTVYKIPYREVVNWFLKAQGAMN